MQLRPYQRQAVDAVYKHLRARDDNPCVVLPTGSGKTHVMGTICRDGVLLWNGRVLILAHVKELLEQAAEKLRAIAPDVGFGVFSAGLKRRELGHAVTIAGIQSVYEKACDIGPVDLIIVDECHLIPEDGEGMYRSFLADAKIVNPNVRVIGLTATPFRMKSGAICTPENILNTVCFEIGVRELIVQGYLCPLRTKAGSLKPDTNQLHIRGGEYVTSEVENLMDDDNLVLSACREIIEHTADRTSVLIFASGVQHGLHICKVLAERHDVECGFICAETLPFDRDSLVHRFRGGSLKYLCNVNVLTTGFDAPHVDCVAMVRPTLSPGLYYQMVGRGFRLSPGKTDCLVLDFGGNVLRHGPVDQIGITTAGMSGDGDAPVKECPQCRALIAAGYTQCPECNHRFPDRVHRQHEATASTNGILSGQTERTEHKVIDTIFRVHVKRGGPPDAPRTMRVDYKVGFNEYISEWVCFEHSGFARHKAAQWWTRRSHDPVPSSVERAIELAEAGALAPTLGITVEHITGEKFDRIVAYRLGDKPPGTEVDHQAPEHVLAPDDGVPF
jgi:DNA repair protein RadD